MDQHSLPIVDGQKVIICKLKPGNDYRMSSIAFPTDEVHLPDWFTCLPFDSEDMSAGIVDKKIENLLGVMKWNLNRSKKEHAQFASLFDLSAI